MSDLQAMLHDVKVSGTFEPLDCQLAALLVRRSHISGEPAIAIVLATLLLSRAVREGHSALTITQLARQARHLQSDAAVAVLIDLSVADEAWWTEILSSSPLVSGGTDQLPIVLVGELLQFKRYYDAEMRIADRVRTLLREPQADGLPAFSIVTGGPGTGKTTFVARRLLELQATHADLRVALAAPTGKAAARLSETIRQRMDELAQSTGMRAEAPAEARTLHRLLGYSPNTNTFRRNATDPLDDDLVIIDEASMVDVLMLDALLRALKVGARLMLVGDHNQLASVDAGDVLGALCRAALTAKDHGPLNASVTVLSTSWRFADQPAIGTLASAILSGDVEAVLRACTQSDTPEVGLRALTVSSDDLVEFIVPGLERCFSAQSPDDLLAAVESFRVLAPEREGRTGVSGINAAIERWLARRGHPVLDTWYHGRPVLVTANDYSSRVYNGDVGVVWREAGEVAVYFRGNDGKVRAIAPVRLPSVETAWAMTVHKSQGSEFDDVLVVLPEHESRTMSRELLYTAVTRAKRRVRIMGSDSALAVAVRRVTGRTSGLAERLQII